MAVIPRVDVTIAENDIFSGAIKILEIIRPQWSKDKITFKMLTDGITNKLVKCKPTDIEEEEAAVLIRVYGNKTDLLIDRAAETRNIILLNNVGLAPDLFATFNNGLVYEFVPGTTLNAKTVTQPNIYNLVARKMAKLHQVTVAGQLIQEAALWDKLQSFIHLVPDIFTDDNKQKSYEKLIPSKHKIKEEINGLKEQLLKLDSPIVFCHNDLLLGNVIYTPSKNCVTFIDFEYASFNYEAFDIGNHFTEYVGIDNIDYSNYPNKQFQYKWLEEYLVTKNGTATQNDIHTLYVQVNQFALAAHLVWGIWALIQAEHSYIDFDFIEYASIRFNEFYSRKEEFLSLQLPR